MLKIKYVGFLNVSNADKNGCENSSSSKISDYKHEAQVIRFVTSAKGIMDIDSEESNCYEIKNNLIRKLKKNLNKILFNLQSRGTTYE